MLSLVVPSVVLLSFFFVARFAGAADFASSEDGVVASRWEEHPRHRDLGVDDGIRIGGHDETYRVVEVDYGGRHPFEILERSRRTTRSLRRRLRGRRRREARRREGATREEGDEREPPLRRRPRGAPRAGGLPRATEDDGPLLLPSSYHSAAGRSDVPPSFDANRPLRIEVNSDPLDHVARSNPSLRPIIRFIQNDVLPEAVRFWSSALRVHPADRITIDPDGHCPGVGSATNVDLIVFANVDYGPCSLSAGGGGGKVLAFAGNCQRDQFDRPTVGYTGICTSGIDLSSPSSRSDVVRTVVHEFGHILGLAFNDLPYFRDPKTGLPRTPRPFVPRVVTCVDGSKRYGIVPDENTARIGYANNGRVRHWEVVTDRVRTVARNHFGCMNMTGGRLENIPTNPSDCFGSHWDHRLYNTEFMSAVQISTVQHLSPLSLAFLEDSGWYTADYAQSRISPFGHGRGCGFVYGDCIVNGEVPHYGRDYFCTTSEQPVGCGPSRTMVAFCDQVEYGGPLPAEYRYFGDESPNTGGALPQLDYCPVYGGTTFTIGHGDSSSTIDASSTFEINCTDPLNSDKPFASYFESYGPQSRCLHTSLSRPHCFEIRCDAESHTVSVVFDGYQEVVCYEEGQEVEIVNLNGGGETIVCPDLAQVCPDLVCPANCEGRGVCDYNRKNPECIYFD